MYLTLFLCAVCLMSCVHTIGVYPTFDDDLETTVKRQFAARSDCMSCILSYNPQDCTRCQNSRSSIIPFHAAKRVSYFPSRSTRTTSCQCCLLSRNNNDYCCNRCKPPRK